MTYLMKRFLRFGCGPLGLRERLRQYKMMDEIMEMSPPTPKTHPHIMPSSVPSLSLSGVEDGEIGGGIEGGVHVLTTATLEKLSGVFDIVVLPVAMDEFPDEYK